MPRDVCAISEDLSPAYATAYAYDDSGNLLRGHAYQQCGRDNRVAINVGRYTSSDPIGINGGLNTFGYVGQNPVMLADSAGLVCVPCAIWAANAAYRGYQAYRAYRAFKAAQRAIQIADKARRLAVIERARNAIKASAKPGGQSADQWGRSKLKIGETNARIMDVCEKSIHSDPIDSLQDLLDALGGGR